VYFLLYYKVSHLLILESSALRGFRHSWTKFEKMFMNIHSSEDITKENLNNLSEILSHLSANISDPESEYNLHEPLWMIEMKQTVAKPERIRSLETQIKLDLEPIHDVVNTILADTVNEALNAFETGRRNKDYIFNKFVVMKQLLRHLKPRFETVVKNSTRLEKIRSPRLRTYIWYAIELISSIGLSVSIPLTTLNNLFLAVMLAAMLFIIFLTYWLDLVYCILKGKEPPILVIKI